MDILAWVIGVLIAIILFGVVICGILFIADWIIELKHKGEHNER
jgi:hypothetical protein